MILTALLLVAQQAPFWAHQIRPPDTSFLILLGEAVEGYVFRGIEQRKQEIWIAGRNSPVRPERVDPEFVPEDSVGRFVSYKYQAPKEAAWYTKGRVQVYDLQRFKTPIRESALGFLAKGISGRAPMTGSLSTEARSSRSIS